MTILIDIADGIARIELARTDKRNAITSAMYEALGEAIQAAEADDTVRVILLHGQPAFFCAGNDIEDFLRTSGDTGGLPARVFMEALTGARKPVVAAVNGPAVGIGTTLLLHCDLVYLGEDAKLSMPFVPLGLCPEFGSSLLLPRLAGHARAAEKLLLGDPIAPQEAVQLGIASAVLPSDQVLAHAKQQAARLAKLPPGAVQVSKQLMKQAEAPAITAHIETELQAFMERLQSDEAKASFQAFLTRR